MFVILSDIWLDSEEVTNSLFMFHVYCVSIKLGGLIKTFSCGRPWENWRPYLMVSRMWKWFLPCLF